MAKKTSVQFYYEYIEQLQDLDDKQFRKVLEAMVIYDETGEFIELDSVTKMAFNFIKKELIMIKIHIIKSAKKTNKIFKVTGTNENKRIRTKTNEYERIPKIPI